MRAQKAFLHTLLGVLLLAPARVAEACAVCFGKSDAEIVKGVEASVLFMIAVTYFLIIGGIVGFVLIRRKALRAQQRPADPV